MTNLIRRGARDASGPGPLGKGRPSHNDPAPPPDHPAGLGEDSGPNPVVRGIVGLLVGLGAGAIAAALTPRPHRARRSPLPGQER